MGLAQLCPKIPTTESGQFAVLGLSLDIGLGRFYGEGNAQKKKVGEKWRKISKYQGKSLTFPGSGHIKDSSESENNPRRK